MSNRVNRAAPLVLILIALLAACGQEPAADAPSEAPPMPAQTTSADDLVGEWRLVLIDMADGEDLAPVADAVPTLTLSAEATPTGSRSFSGSGGCNRMMGSYDAGSSGRFSMAQPPAMTMMMCAEPVMRVEQLLGLGLESASTWSVDGDVLEIGFGGGTLRFERAPGA